MERLYEMVQLAPDTVTEFVEKKQSDVVCQRCYAMEPLLQRSPCGHGFCCNCLKDLPSGIIRCPADGSMFLRSEMECDEILKAEVFCTNRIEGCDKVTRLDELKAHLRDCPYTRIACPQGCAVVVVRRTLVEHIIQQCSRRADNCKYCLEELPHEVKLEHEEVCPRRPQSCRHCGKHPIPTSELDNHYKECGRMSRACIAEPLGCEHKGNREEVDAHKNSWPAHSDVIIESMLAIRSKLEKHQEVETQVIKQLTEVIDQIEKWKSNLENEQKDFLRREEALQREVDGMRRDIEMLKKHAHEFHVPSGTVLYMKKSSKNKIEAYTVGVATEKLLTSQSVLLAESSRPQAPERMTSRTTTRRNYFRQEGSSSFVDKN